MMMKAVTRRMVKSSRTEIPKMEVTGKLNQSRPGAHRRSLQMCLIHLEFKRFRRLKPEQFANLSPDIGKLSSIIRAKVLSIMCAGDVGLTSLFKPKRARLWHALVHRSGT